MVRLNGIYKLTLYTNKTIVSSVSKCDSIDVCQLKKYI